MLTTSRTFYPTFIDPYRAYRDFRKSPWAPLLIVSLVQARCLTRVPIIIAGPECKAASEFERELIEFRWLYLVATRSELWWMSMTVTNAAISFSLSVLSRTLEQEINGWFLLLICEYMRSIYTVLKGFLTSPEGVWRLCEGKDKVKERI
jgi:hypothetical protein